MYTKKKYSVKDMALWTRSETLLFILLSVLFVFVYEYMDIKWLKLPWTPIALIGTAVAFVIGFQNNAAYGRIWEARKIWGGIVNTSRSFTMLIKDTITNEYAEKAVDTAELNTYKRVIVYRHLAWLSAMRHAMRTRKVWEVFTESKTNREWFEKAHIPEYITSLEDDLKTVLSEDELKYVMTKTNKATTLLSLQSKHLRALKEKGLIWEFSFLELEALLTELFTLQGKSERIKNFPYPRQYATLNFYFVWIFLFLLPFGVIPEFSKIGESFVESYPQIAPYFVWFSIPFCVVVSWVFHTMERIGRVGENPFEGSANDVPISTIARGIEIDLREMIDESSGKIPGPLPSQGGVQM